MSRQRTADRLALDRASVRTIDQDGHLHVAESNISRAVVNGYLGWEIPGYEKLGLQPQRLYQMFRDPAELEKAATTFNGKPLTSFHRVQTADDHNSEVVVGAVNNVRWDAPYLKAELVVWDGDAISAIESGEQKVLSSAYRYDPVMQPGEYEGERFDGRMTNIQGNHVSLVSSGRAGSTVAVGDQALPQETGMKGKPLSRQALLAEGALTAYFRPKLAQDAKLDLKPILAGVTAKTWKTDKARIKRALDAAVKGKLMKDADIEDVIEVLEELKEEKDETGEPSTDQEWTDEDEAALQAMLARKKAATGDQEPDDKTTKAGMDAAIALARKQTEDAVIARMRAMHIAEQEVRPHIGELAVAQDSAEAVYKLALDMAGVETAGVPPAAYRAMVKMLPNPGAPSSLGHFATPNRGQSDLHKQFSGAVKLKHVY